VSHKAVRALIQKVIAEVHDGVQYSYGLESDFNETKKKGFLMVHTDALTASITYAVDGTWNYSKGWSVTMLFCKYDTYNKSKADLILDATDEVIDLFVNRLNRTEGVLLTSMSQDPFIRAYADILTGHTLAFTIILEDDFDYCSVNAC
jgi:hypothetical protein